MKVVMLSSTRRPMWSPVALSFLFLFLFLFATAPPPAAAIRSFPAAPSLPRFAEAPEYRNAPDCRPVMSSSSTTSSSSSVVCDPSAIHVAMTLDLHYLRGTVAAVYSILKHATCPENLFFHFLSSHDGHANADTPLAQLLRSTFPSLRFRIYRFDDQLVRPLISSSVRDALENPLNYARTYLADILPACVSRVIYLDSDLLLVDDITRLWSTRLTGSRVVAAPEYCNANFTNYFTPLFWSNRSLSRVFDGRSPCYFNTGVMVIDLRRWRSGDFGKAIEEWMRVQKEMRIYDLGSLPPFLLVFAGHIEPIEHRWNQHGLGGDNVVGRCRKLHPGPVSLLHWSGKGKPWSRLDAKSPCPLDSLWAPYDLLHKSTSPSSSR